MAQTFVLPGSRAVRVGARTTHIRSGQEWTVIDDKTEYINPSSREVSRDVISRYFNVGDAPKPKKARPKKSTSRAKVSATSKTEENDHGME